MWKYPDFSVQWPFCHWVSSWVASSFMCNNSMAFLRVCNFMSAFLTHVWPFNDLFTSEYLHECLPQSRVTIQWIFTSDYLHECLLHSCVTFQLPFYQWVSSWVPSSFTCDQAVAYLPASIFMPSSFTCDHSITFVPASNFMSGFVINV